ncbi:PilZ domain-containing protein [Brevundimonas sp.]|uniref:PilZ domain-containing protein n=1 Tax=Brevundimonas sp. TaxID=1871086 RepID=UPI0037C155D2
MIVFGSKSGRDGAERRAEPRRTVNARGVISAPGLEMACLIVDLSDHGMKLRLDRGVALPAEVVVIDVAEGTAYVSTLVWQKHQEAGLRATGAQSLRGLIPARLTGAREAWMRAGGR